MAEKLTELEQLELEEKKLRVEHLRVTVKEQQEKQHAAKKTAEQQEAMIKETQRNEKLRQEQCNHRKGGKGLEGLSGNGSDTNFCVIKHQYPDGRVGVMCTRCQAQWWPGDTKESHHTGFSYQDAYRWPTDNEMSGSVTFTITKTEGAKSATAQ